MKNLLGEKGEETTRKSTKNISSSIPPDLQVANGVELQIRHAFGFTTNPISSTIHFITNGIYIYTLIYIYIYIFRVCDVPIGAVPVQDQHSHSGAGVHISLIQHVNNKQSLCWLLHSSELFWTASHSLWRRSSAPSSYEY